MKSILSKFIYPYIRRIAGAHGHSAKEGSRIWNNSDPSYMSSSLCRQRRRIAKKLNNPRIEKITFHTLRHWKATEEYHRTKDILYVMKTLGHKTIEGTLLYIDLEKAIYGQPRDEEFAVRVAENVDEACNLIEAGFEYITGDYHNGGKIFRKRK